MPGIAEELFINSDKLPIRLYCSICLDVAEEAIITQCDHLFCTECIQQLQEANSDNCECPNCRELILPITAATNARNFLSQQQVFCSEIDSLRCGWIGKYSMWHTHRAKYCQRASQSDKRDAKNAISTEIGNFSKEELIIMSVSRLRKILQQYLKINRKQLMDTDIAQHFNWKQFLEKNEYVNAIVKFQSMYGIKGRLMNHSPSKINDNQFPTTYETLKQLKIRELSSYLRSKNIDPSSSQYACIEKSDLIKLVLKTQKHYREIINGQSYDPKLEKQQFSAPVLTPHNIEEKAKEKEDNYSSNTAYHFTSEHLRRSSINRIDINQPANYQQSRSNNDNHQSMYNYNNHNHNHNHAAAAAAAARGAHNHHHHHHPYARAQPQPQPQPFFSSMPHIPHIPHMPNMHTVHQMFDNLHQFNPFHSRR